MRKVTRCAHCAICKKIMPAGFTAVESYLCPLFDQEVESDDGCTFGVRGIPEHTSLYPDVCIADHAIVYGYEE